MSTTVSAKMTAIANEIRTLSDTTSLLGLDAMAERVGEANEEVVSQEDLIADIIAALEGKAVESDDPVLQAKTATASTEQAVVVTPDTGYDGLSQVTISAIPTAEQATPSINVSSGGLITASATQGEGYVEAGTKSMTQQLTTQAAQTITPGTSDKTIAPGRYLTGTQTIKGDANLVAENIAEGVSIFGVLGTLASSGSTPEGLTAVEYGEIVPSWDGMELTFQHSMGVVPRAGVLWLASDDEFNGVSNENVAVSCFASFMDYIYVAYSDIGGNSTTFVPGEDPNYFSTTNATFFGPSFAVGQKYNYIICA